MTRQVYATEAERAHRFRIFKENLIRADELNRLNGERAFGVTKFSVRYFVCWGTHALVAF
jgi:hypothetical protein